MSVTERLEEYRDNLREKADGNPAHIQTALAAEDVADTLDAILEEGNEDTESVEELKRRELAGQDPQQVLEHRMDYIIQSFSDLHAKWGRTRRRDEPELESMKDDAKLLEEAAWELQIAIDLYRAEDGGWTTEAAEDGGSA